MKANKHTNEEGLWAYNCLDCTYTREVGEVELAAVDSMGLEEVHAFQQALFEPVLMAMLRGVRIDLAARKELIFELQEELSKREAFFETVLGHSLNPRSALQMKKLFYNDLQQPEIKTRAKKGKPGHVTLNDDALDKIAKREPILKPLIDGIREYRSLGVFLSTFAMAPLDSDGRMRCSYNICGTETYRFSSSENAFGSGTNLQNLPKGDESGLFPNIRKLFIPDPGYTFFDMDLDRADLQVVVWEADDAELKAMLRENVDLHAENARTLNCSRQMAKMWVHGCVTAGHELLTPKGWMKVEEYLEGTPIAIWKDGEIAFEIPASFNRDVANDLVVFEGESWSQEMTWDHRVIYKDKDVYRVKRAFECPDYARLPKSGLYSGTIRQPYAALIAAYQADGYIDERGRLRFHFTKERKVERLKQIYPEAVVYSNSDGTYTVDCPDHPLSSEWKIPGPWMLAWDDKSLDEWLNEISYWDSHIGKTGRIEFVMSNSSIREWVATIAQLRGKAAAGFDTKSGFGSAIYGTSINNRPFARLSSMQVSRRSVPPTPVFCPQTSSGFWMFRRNGKIGITGNTNYGGSPRTMAMHCGITVRQAEFMRNRWFSAHPGILAWHERTAASLREKRSVENKFGYRRHYFDRVDSLLPEALAWIPQSTVACYINRVWMEFFRHLKEVHVLLQVHDSLAGQIPTHRLEALLPRMKELARIVVPYEDPLIIPTGIKLSPVSWGDCA